MSINQARTDRDIAHMPTSLLHLMRHMVMELQRDEQQKLARTDLRSCHVYFISTTMMKQCHAYVMKDWKPAMREVYELLIGSLGLTERL